MQTIEQLVGRGESFAMYHPAGFRALKQWLSAAKAYCEHGDLTRTQHECASGELGAILTAELVRQGAWKTLDTASRTRKTNDDRWRHVITWYHGLKHLKLIHATRDAGYPKLPWREALAQADFLPGFPTAESDLRQLETLRAIDEESVL